MEDLIVIEGPEQRTLDPKLPDGGLAPAVGVHSFQVFRASNAVPEITDGKGWTYHHHVDMACWKGRLYVGWNSCERDEDVWPSRELYSTSLDGREWAQPSELFPQGVSTPLRMYFFRASNDRMLAIAGLRANTADTDEDLKGALVVREIHADHSLSDVFILQGLAVGTHLLSFDHSPDEGFTKACRELLADTVFLEQQDRGKLLGPRRMKWHDAASWPAREVPGDSQKWVAGKAYSFFRRPDGMLVGVSKMGWTTTSRDDGRTWSQPVVPPTLITGKAKVWAQQTRDERFALVYNPSTSHRFPLAIVTSSDGITFNDMRIVQGELPVQRYAGLHRSIGPQYVRGISHWSDDGSRANDNAIWLVYSMNKEDIWVSRIPLPVRADLTSGDAPVWNLYSPKWAPATIDGDELGLEDRDPHDYASATLILPPIAPPPRDARLSLDMMSLHGSREPLHVELVGDVEAPRPMQLANAIPGQWQTFELHATHLRRIIFRTKPPRGIGRPAVSRAHPADPATDRPHAPIAFRVRNVRVTS